MKRELGYVESKLVFAHKAEQSEAFMFFLDSCFIRGVSPAMAGPLTALIY